MVKGLKGRIDDVAFFAWMDDYCDGFDDMSDGAWQCACESAVERFNKEYRTKVDPFDGWMAWVRHKGFVETYTCARHPGEMCHHITPEGRAAIGLPKPGSASEGRVP